MDPGREAEVGQGILAEEGSMEVAGQCKEGEEGRGWVGWVAGQDTQAGVGLGRVPVWGRALPRYWCLWFEAVRQGGRG